MALTVPYPTVPTDGQAVEASTLLANLNAVYQAIQQFDASQIQAATLVASAFAAAINPNTLLGDTLSPFARSGCIWTGSGASLVGSMSSGIIYQTDANGKMYRVSVGAVGSNTFTASKDTYVDIDYNGNIVYQAVSNNATAPVLTANSLRVAKVVTNGTGITLVVQAGADSLGNIIYPIGALSTTQIQNPYKFNVYRASAQSLTNGSFTKINYDSELFDTSQNFDVVTNHNFTAPIPGYYYFIAHFQSSATASNTRNIVSIYKNGAEALRGFDITPNSGTVMGGYVEGLLQLASGDTVDVRVDAIGANTVLDVSTTALNCFIGWLVSRT